MPCSVDDFRVLVFEWVFLKGREQCFCSFYRPESSNCFPVKTHVFGRSFIFYNFVCKHGALHFRLHVVALPASVTMSWLAKITSKLSMSGFDFLVPVLQSSNSFDLNAFLSIFVPFTSYCLQGKWQFVAFKFFAFNCYIVQGRSSFFLLFFRSEASNSFPVTAIFSEGLSFLHF